MSGGSTRQVWIKVDALEEVEVGVFAWRVTAARGKQVRGCIRAEECPFPGWIKGTEIGSEKHDEWAFVVLGVDMGGLMEVVQLARERVMPSGQMLLNEALSLYVDRASLRQIGKTLLDALIELARADVEGAERARAQAEDTIAWVGDYFTKRNG